MNTNEQILGSNVGQLVGRIVSSPVKSHEAFNENFYEFILEVKRLSGNSDQIPVSFGDHLIKDVNDLEIGKTIAVSGEFRSFNKLVDGRSKLMLYFFAKNILSEDITKAMNFENENHLKLKGYICKQPVFRETPFGRQICDLLLAVNRQTFNRSDYIPCLAWGRNAYFVKQWGVGTCVEVEGRIQSRAYKKKTELGEEDRVAYEVSCNTISVVENPGNSVNTLNSHIQEQEAGC